MQPKIKHDRPRSGKTVKVGFEPVVQNHVSGFNPKPSAIASLFIPA
jgi:hypothetical protein